MTAERDPHSDIHDDFHDAWAAALDALEMDVEQAEHLLRVGDPPEATVPGWQPPALPGALPLELRERAHALLDRQLHAASALTRAMHATGRQRAVAGRFDTGNGRAGRAVFVDRAF